MSERLDRLNRILVGCQLTDTPSILTAIDAWTKRRLRMIRWKEWKTISARKRNRSNKE
ncbi:hypothetical protein [Bacillus solitudinis]|uniref:hypothetical protein n=1 Tax=Bacillus solitudinis TaxID=2014074 RepID=UPI002228347F|nr:hypothetical protein [Bacillus solitudinis]